MALWGSAEAGEGARRPTTEAAARKDAAPPREDAPADGGDGGFDDFLRALVCLENEAPDEKIEDERADDGGLAAFERALESIGGKAAPPKMAAGGTNEGDDDKEADGDYASFLAALASPAPPPRASPARRAPPSSFVGSNNGTDRTRNNADAAAVWSTILANMSPPQEVRPARTLDAEGRELERLREAPPAWLLQKLEEEHRPTWRGCLRYWLGTAPEEKTEEGDDDGDGMKVEVRVAAVERTGMEGRA